MGLQPLEFADCLADSPYFREKLHEHERELESTSKGIKSLISHGKQVFDAAKSKYICMQLLNALVHSIPQCTDNIALMLFTVTSQ